MDVIGGMEDEAPARFNGPPEMDRSPGVQAGGLDVQLLEEIGKRKRIEGLIDHQAHGALGAVGANVDDGPGEPGIFHAWHGDQKVAGHVVFGIVQVGHLRLEWLAALPLLSHRPAMGETPFDRANVVNIP